MLFLLTRVYDYFAMRKVRRNYDPYLKGLKARPSLGHIEILPVSYLSTRGKVETVRVSLWAAQRDDARVSRVFSGKVPSVKTQRPKLCSCSLNG